MVALGVLFAFVLYRIYACFMPVLWDMSTRCLLYQSSMYVTCWLQCSHFGCHYQPLLTCSNTSQVHAFMEEFFNQF